MVEEKENLLIKMDDIKVTRSTAVIGPKTYAISTIKSVSLEQKKISPVAKKAVWILSFVSLILGILFCLATFAIRFVRLPDLFSDWPRINVHFLLAGVALLLLTLWSIGFEAIQPTYLLQINTELGKFAILESKDKDYIKKVVNAINEAVADQEQKQFYVEDPSHS